ncbi:MAG: hypothetical protein IKZ96_04040 [Bacilli bacterium]|nr:hypothetical protein [Bacilli bacterium]
MNTKDSSLTENWIQVKEINNGMIFLDDKSIVSGVKISPRNIFILTEGEQNRIINSLKEFYNLIEYEFWLVVADRPVDINLYVSQLELQMSNEQSPARRKLLADDIEKAEMFSMNNVVDTEYYILVKDTNSDALTKKVRGLINNMAGTGLIATQTSNEDLRSILDNFLNGGVTFKSGSVITE